jgi:hypothetical protein
MRMLHHSGRRLVGAVSATAAAGAMIASGLAIAGAVSPAAYAAKAKVAGRHHNENSCHLGHGIKHVIMLRFDNVHYFRDNPNVPSDLELMPNLLNFIESNGTLLTNNHTPLIAHTADDLLTSATGLYGDRHGDPIANSNRSYNSDGTTSLASDFTYWTGAIPNGTNPLRDMNPNMVYSPVPPATASHTVTPDKVTPATWVPFTKAGCNVGDVATANEVLENTTPDIANLFGPNSPEAKQLAADPDSFKDPETADYVGIAVHCAKHSAFCADAKAVKFGQTTPSATEVPDLLPDQPGGYHGFDMLLGHRYVAPQFGAGTPNVMHNGFQVTNAGGNLVDLNGNEIDGAFLTNHPGFPGFGTINAGQSLAYAADMLERGVPVVNTYIADIHGNEGIPSLSGPGGACAGLESEQALGSGSACYIAQGQYYNQMFGLFFQRLASDGITAKNTLFVISSDEGDHEVGANVGRFVQPTPANCDGAAVGGDTVTPDVLCTYPAGSFGELGGNINGMLTAAGNTTPFTLENDTAPEFYVTGQPSSDGASVRSLEHLVAGLTNNNPYTGTNQTVDNFLADPTEEAILHMVNADPARTPTFAMFAKPDYFLFNGGSSCGGPCVTQNIQFGYDHGAYAAEINTNYVGFVGPGVKHLGADNAPGAGPNSAGADSGQVEVVDTHLHGPWTDETDIRPTIMYLTGLKDEYIHDGRVITQILTHRNHALRARGVTFLGECYKQLNSSVGRFGAFTLQADTNAINSSSAGDTTYLGVVNALNKLEVVRDRLAIRIKNELDAAEFANHRVGHVGGLLLGCLLTIRAAHHLANHS